MRFAVPGAQSRSGPASKHAAQGGGIGGSAFLEEANLQDATGCAAKVMALKAGLQKTPS
jgi:hypothetical protein